MAVYDLVTWAPRISGTGDDKYNIPGSTKLDSTVDTTNTRVPINAGTVLTGTPSYAAINASVGVNQIIGAINRRIGKSNSQFGTTVTLLSYINAHDTILASQMTTIKNAIIALRAMEGLPAWSGTFSTITGGSTKILGKHFAEFRKALAIDATLLLVHDGTNDRADYWFYKRLDNPFGTISSETYQANTRDTAGKKAGAGGTGFRGRQIVAYRMPDWIQDVTVADVRMKSTTVPSTVSTYEAFTYEVWQSNADIYTYVTTPAGGGSAYGHFDHLIGSQAIPLALGGSGVAENYGLDVASAIALAGSRCCLTFCTDKERQQTGLDPRFAAGQAADVLIGSMGGSTNTPELEITF